MEDAQAPTFADKVIGASVLVVLVGLVIFGIYAAFAYWLVPWKDEVWRAKYADCVARGGTITEGGFSGPQCVGVKTLGNW
jgi:hypothetical protein